MISENSILRRLPAALVLEQRMAIEAIAFALLSIETTHLRIALELPKHIRDVPKGCPLGQRISRVRDCWTIIDSTYNIFNPALKNKQSLASEKAIARILSFREIASGLRNVMDHLYQRTGDLSAIKDPQNNYLGDFVYIVEDDTKSESGGASVGYAYVQMTAGLMTYGGSTSGLRRTDLDPAIAVGQYFFEAFGQIFYVSSLLIACMISLRFMKRMSRPR